MRGSAREAVLRKFGMLFQGAALFDSLPVWENVAFGLIQGRGMARARARDIADGEARQGGTRSRKWRDTAPSELSGGMQKRVGLARAIAAEPEIIFFDEPTTGLDPIMADVINDLIVSTVKDLGVTTLSITHDMASARKISSRIAMLYAARSSGTGRRRRSTQAAILMSISSSMAAPKARSRWKSAAERACLH